MNFIKITKEEYEICYANFIDQYVVIDDKLIYNGEIVGKVDIKIRRHSPIPYTFTALPINNNSFFNIIRKIEKEEKEMDLDGAIIFEEEETF